MNHLNPEKSEMCPTQDELSAFVDGAAGDRTDAIAAHLTGCDRCRETVALYRQLGELIHGRADDTIPEGLTDRIKHAVKHAAPEPGGWSLHSPALGGLIFRAAAVLVVGCSVAFYLLQQQKTPPPGPQITVITAPAEDRVPLRTAPTTAIRPRLFDSGDTTGGIPLNSLVGASYGDIPQPVFTEAADRGAVVRRPPAEIADQVRQVWSIAGLNEAEKTLQKFGSESKLGADRFRVSLRDGQLHLDVMLSKLELVNLVRTCRAAGFELLSPSSPQPEQNIFRGRAADLVRYQADFVPDAPAKN